MKRFLKCFILYVLYVFLLCFCYRNFIAEAYRYNGFYDGAGGVASFISAVLLMLAFGVIYKQKTDKYSKLIIYILFIINYIPSLVLNFYMPQEISFLFLLTLYWAVAIVCVNLFDKIKIRRTTHIARDIKKNKIETKSEKFLYVLVAMNFAVVLMNIHYTGVNIGFDDVYQLRYNYLSANIPTVLLYLFAAIKVINPVLYIYLRKKKSLIWARLAFLVQILAFLCDGSKSTLFSLAIAILIAGGEKRKKEYNYLKSDNFKTFLFGGIVAANAVGMLEFLIARTTYIYNYFIRRLFFIPAFLHIKYYDFFSNNSLDFFRQSFIGRLGFASPYDTPIQNMIGAKYFNDSTMIANNGLFSDAYANIGAIGALLMPILLVLVLKVLDASAREIKPIYITTVLISVPYIFLSSSLFTVLLTHGFIALCLILRCAIPREKHESGD